MVLRERRHRERRRAEGQRERQKERWEIYARRDFRGPTVEDGWLGLFLVCAALLSPLPSTPPPKEKTCQAWDSGQLTNEREARPEDVPRLHGPSGD